MKGHFRIKTNVRHKKISPKEKDCDHPHLDSHRKVANLSNIGRCQVSKEDPALHKLRYYRYESKNCFKSIK